LISLPEPNTPQQQQLLAALKAWLLTWLTLLSTTSLANAAAAGAAVAAAAAQRDLPVLLGALLAPGGRQQQQQQGAGGGSGVVLGVDVWLPVVVQAAAGVRGDVDGDGDLQQGDDSQSEGERCWNIRESYMEGCVPQALSAAIQRQQQPACASSKVV
jgi:hypothetical protein